MIKQNRFIALRFFLITLMIALTLILTPIVPHSTRFDRDSKTEVPTIGVQGKLVPSFCADRLPDLKMVEIANVPLPDRYPTTPGSVIYEYDSPVTFHPLQALLPYLVALDNRALLGKVSREVDGAALTSLLDWLETSGHLIRRNEMVLLEYPFSTEHVPAPFISCMTQAGLVYLASVSYLLTGRDEDLEIARGALHAFETDYREGGVRVADQQFGGYPWYLEYANPSMEPEQLLFVLNGFLYALHTLAKTQETGISTLLPELPRIYEEGVRALKDAIPSYEASWGWSYYDRTGGNRASAGYHAYQTLLLGEIACREKDEDLMATAERWWIYYKQKMPYLLIPSYPGVIQYLHPKGVYPHLYLKDEYQTILVYRSSLGSKTAVRPEMESIFFSPAGTLKDALNLEEALLPSDTEEIEIWWYDSEEILGMPNLYRIDTIDTKNKESLDFPIGDWLDCSSKDAYTTLSARGVSGPGILLSQVDDQRPLLPWILATRNCVRLQEGILPSRQLIHLNPDQLQIAFRGKYDRPGPGKGWHSITIVPSGELSGYQARQVAIIIKGLDINPQLYPYLQIPLLFSDVEAMTIDGVSPDESRVSRYTPVQGPREQISLVLVNWESFPHYSGKPITSVDIRLILPEDMEEGALAIGPLTLISSEGLLSDFDFIVEGDRIYRAMPNGNVHIGRPSAYFFVPGILFYERLLEQFPEDHPGKGPEPYFGGIKHQPMTYGLVISAEVLRFRAFPNEESRGRIRKSVRWLLDNSDLDKDGLPGWGLPDAWDAFSDGTVNPENHPYTIATAIIIQALLDALTLPSLWSDGEREAILDIIKETSMRWCRYVWTETDEGGFFWYSPAPSDAHFVPNVSAMLLGSMARLLQEHGYIFNDEERRLIQDRVDRAARAVISKAAWRQGAPFWAYCVAPTVCDQKEPQDLVHHAYVLWGMELYRRAGGNIPWTVEQAIESLNRFWKDGVIYDYPQDVVYTGTQAPYEYRPAVLWGAGMMLAFYARQGDPEKSSQVLRTIAQRYGPWPRLRYWPADFSLDTTFYARHAAHVLWGTALFAFSGANSQ